MLKNNFIIAFRLLTRQRVYSVINLLGLSLGIASFLVIVLFYQFQNSYDQFHSKKDQIFRVNKYLDGMKGKRRISKVSSSLVESVSGSVTGIKNSVRLVELIQELHYGEKGFNEWYLYAADNSFFEIFDFELLAGDPTSSLSDLNSIVLSETLAKKYFGAELPLGKIMTTIDNNGQKVDVKVTGVMKDPPANTHLIFNGLLSYPTLKNFVSNERLDSDWGLSHTYLLLDENANPKDVEKQVSDLVLHQVPLEDFNTASLPLQPITEIYFNPTKDGGSQRGSELLTKIFLLVGIFILLIASLNYVNLATARSLKRSKEVGIRKVSGASKKQLVYQFIGESIFFCLASLVLALILVKLFIPTINNFSNYLYKIHLNPYFFFDPQFVLIAISTALITGL
ncbi:MAG: ABC transporter permease, partial [Cyclobacteriaceae bacterium]|nr:ABC transporter permease [Cyclobacteriaceae bacterium]